MTFFEKERRLYDAVHASDAQEVRAALADGADVHVGKDRLIIDAAEIGNVGIVQILLDAGANPKARIGQKIDMVFGRQHDPKPRALIAAEDEGHTEVVNVLNAWLQEDKPRQMTAKSISAHRSPDKRTGPKTQTGYSPT
jgi:hypothetical protein